MTFTNRMTGIAEPFKPATESVEEWKERFLSEHAERLSQSLKEIEEQRRQLVGKFTVAFDDGEHYNELETFDTIDDAKKVFVDEVNTFKEDPEDYACSSPDEWDDDFYPHFELKTWKLDGDDVDDETLNVWTPHGGFDEEVN